MATREQNAWVDDNASPERISAGEGRGIEGRPAVAGNAALAAGTDKGAAASQGAATGVGGAGPVYAVVQGNPPEPDTEETRRLKDNYGAIAPVTFAYAVFYAFCMYKNGSGITFPFFVGGSLLFLRFSCTKLGITLKKGSAFYMAAMVLLGISTFCTDDGRLIFFNKLGVFLLTMSLLLKQYVDTSKWKLGKYLCGICQLVFASLGELGRPVSDGILYRKSGKCKSDKRVWSFALGLLIGVPLLFVVMVLLASADAIFGQMAERFLDTVNLANGFNILFRIAFLFFASYGLTAYLCKRKIKEEVRDRRRGEPVLAITVTGLLTALYLLFSGIQIGGLFLGRLQLPSGYTYAMYAREGFFQLLTVGFLNLAIVLGCMAYFRESRVLKWILTVMSFCTFVMIASSAMRMIIYIRYYYLTFLRILVLWGLMLLAALFAGVVIGIYKENFPLFRYSCAVVTVLYLALSFVHPDYIIAKVNVANAQRGSGQTQETAQTADDSRSDVLGGSFFLAKEPYKDYGYLQRLSADAAPALVPYLEELGYHMEAFQEKYPMDYAMDTELSLDRDSRYGQDIFGYYWMARMKERTRDMGVRTFNLSRFLALRYLGQGSAF